VVRQDTEQRGLSRRAVLAGSAGVVAAAAAAGVGVNLARDDDGEASAGSASPSPSGPRTRAYASRPDLAQPLVTVTTPAPVGAGGYVLLTPASGEGLRGPMMVDPAGHLVWVLPVTGGANIVATNFQVQSYQGQPVLTWWQGSVSSRGVGVGELVVADRSYQQIARLQIGGQPADLHEFALTPAGTALCLTYEVITADLTPVGGGPAQPVYDGVVHELDVATGRTLFTWRASQHVAIDESYQPIASTAPSPGPSSTVAGPTNAGSGVGGGSPAPSGPLPYDYIHLNSVGLDSDGNLLISARHTAAVYKVDRTTGAVLWRLGGKRSDFTFGPGARFWYQHDARRRSDGRLSVFDNGAGITPEEKVSRGLMLTVDESARTASLAAELPQPEGKSAGTQGSVRELPGGGSFVGWGAQPYFTEFAADGRVVFAGHLPADNSSYRAMRVTWSGHPTDRPTAVARVEDGTPVGYVSWNGATEVAAWRVRSGARADALAPGATVARTGFETRLPLPSGAGYLAVTALDAAGASLGESVAVPVPA